MATAGFDQAPITIELAPAGLPTGAPRGLNPTALVAGDFNGSGSLDLAVVNSSSSNVAILLDFDGTGFASKTFVPVGTLPSSIAAGYVAGEDKVAFLAVSNELGNTVSILRNNGHGVFAADPNPIPVGNRPASVVAGYFNDDPYPDLAVANYGTHPSGSDLGSMSILLANGPNGFHPAQPACPVGMGPASLVVADLDGDGNADLAVANFLSNTVTVCAGAGDGTFTAVAELSAGSGPVDIAVANLDGSGWPDLLVANVTSNDVAILRNRSVPGSFQFEPPESYGVARFAGGARLALAVADFDGSGLTVVVTARDSGGLGVSETFVLTVLPGDSWHNQSNPYDVNGDGEVTPMDVLALINHLNAHGSGPLPSTPEPPPYLDVNNNGHITPSDVLAVINYLNTKAGNGEGEAGGRVSVDMTADVGPALPQATWFPGAAVTDRGAGPWSCEPVRGRAVEVSGASEADRLLFVHSQPLEEREILPFFNSATDGTGSSDELEDILAEIACDIAEAFLAL